MGNGANPWAPNPLPAGVKGGRRGEGGQGRRGEEGQPPALVEIKNSLYYTSHSAPTPAPPVHPLRSLPPSIFLYTASLLSPHTPPSFPPPSCYLTRPLFPLPLYPSPSTHHIPPLRRRLVRADRLNMRPAIPDGTNIIKVRLHAKPVKYRRFPSFEPLCNRRLPRRPFVPSRRWACGIILPLPFLFAGLYCLTCNCIWWHLSVMRMLFDMLSDNVIA